MSEPGLSVIPLEARPYQGAAAGVATRLVANTIDTVVVLATMLGTYAGVAAVLFILSPRTFEAPDFSPVLSVLTFLGFAIVYLTGTWWIAGQTFGDRVMGIRVLSRGHRPLRLPRAFVRALLCAVFPIGLMWCVVSPARRSVQDLLLWTVVVYDWMPRATVAPSVAPTAIAGRPEGIDPGSPEPG